MTQTDPAKLLARVEELTAALQEAIELLEDAEGATNYSIDSDFTPKSERTIPRLKRALTGTGDDVLADHERGCPALGGYGHAPGECICKIATPTEGRK
jgi:hypothetical protein